MVDKSLVVTLMKHWLSKQESFLNI